MKRFLPLLAVLIAGCATPKQPTQVAPTNVAVVAAQPLPPANSELKKITPPPPPAPPAPAKPDPADEQSANQKYTDALGNYARAQSSALDQSALLQNNQATITALEEIRTQYPHFSKLPDLTYRLAYLYDSIGESAFAMQACQDLLAKFPDSIVAPLAAIEIATLDAKLNKPDEMIKALRFFIQQYPKHPKVGDALFAIATQLEKQQQFKSAIAAYRDLIKWIRSAPALTDDTRSVALDAQQHITALLARTEDEPAVVADDAQFLAQFAADPTAARTIVNTIATIYQASQHFMAGCDTLEKLVQQYQANPAIRQTCLINIIDLSLISNDLTRLEAAVTRLVNDPDKNNLSVDGLLTMGNASLRLEQYTQAKDCFDQALKHPELDEKTIVRANFGRGRACLALGQLDAAQTAITPATGDNGYVPLGEVEVALGNLNEAKGDLEDAVRHYNKALAARGDLAFEAAYHLGKIFIDLAVDENNKPLNALQIRENKKLAVAYFARLLFYSGPMADEGSFRTPECQEALGDFVRACAGYKDYIKRFPKGKFLDAAKDKVKILCPPVSKP